MKFVDMDETSD